MQPMQLANGVKRVQGDPVKGNFQDHERFMLKLYTACRDFRFRRFIESQELEDLKAKVGESPEETLRRIENNVIQFFSGWETSKHEPSRLVAIFMKCVESYKRCKAAIRKEDFWSLEKESNEWMGPWKVCGKTTYLREQCEYIEHVYDNNKFHPWLRELMRRNSLCVLTSTLKGMAFDEVNELYNAWLKIPPASSYLSTAVNRSKHTMAERKCSNKVWGLSFLCSTSGASEASDVLLLEGVLAESGIFLSNHETAMCDDYFWKYVRKPKNVGTAIDKQKELMCFTPHEEKVWERYCQPAEMRQDYDELEEDGNDDDDAVSCVSSCAESLSSRTGNANDENIDETHSPSDLDSWQQLSEESKIEKATEGLKHLGNMKRRKFNKLGLTDPFISGAALLKKSIKKQRDKALYKERREHELIQLAVKYFKRQMKYRTRILDKAIARQKTKTFNQHVPAYKLHFRLIMEQKRMNERVRRTRMNETVHRT